MIVVDSSIWISYFSDPKSVGSLALDRAVAQDEDLCILPVIAVEVLMGFKSERDFKEAQAFLERVTMIPLEMNLAIKAAQLYRKMRSKGVTVRGAIDCLIAQACIDLGATLLTLDRDFRGIAQHSSLKLEAFSS